MGSRWCSSRASDAACGGVPVTPVEKRWCSSYSSALKKKDSAAPNARPSDRKKAMMAPAVSAS